MAPGEEAFAASLRQQSPELVGIKAFSKDVAAAAATAAVARNILPDATIILGGPHPSCAEPTEIMHDFPDIDFAFRGEAEAGLPRLAALLAAGPPSMDALAAIDGLAWRDGDQVRHTPSPVHGDLTTLPHPDWRQLDPRQYQPVQFRAAADAAAPMLPAPIITTRGCPGQCSFCSAWRINGKRIRFRDPEDVVDEMAMLQHDYGVQNFMVMDNCFTSSKEHFTSICRGILRRNITATWDCCSYERLDHLTDDTVALMRQAGCRMLHLGIESASTSIRGQLQKHCSLDGYRRVVSLCKRHGIAPVAWFILGFPGETVADMRETIRFGLGLGATQCTFTPCFPLPGSAVYASLQAKHGVERIQWVDFDVKRSPWPMHAGSTAQLRRMLLLGRVGAKVAATSATLGRLMARML